MNDESTNELEQFRYLINKQNSEIETLTQANAILRKAVKYYSSGESIQIHTDIAMRALYDEEFLVTGGK